MSKLAVRFLVVTFAIMLLCWGACILCGFFGINLTSAPILYVPYLLGGLSPTIASYIVLRREHVICSFRDWLAINFSFRGGLLSYLLIPVLAGVFFLCLCLISGYESGAPLFSIVFMMPVMLFAGGLEETGWRGILQPELEKKLGYTIATVIVAAIWWLWHLPLFFIVGVSQYGANYVCFGFNVLGLSFALSSIKKTSSSTFLCILFHVLSLLFLPSM